MNEKHTKILTTLGKISGAVTLVASKAEMIPEKYAWAGVIVVVLSSTLKDTIMWLGDLWDDGKLNKSYKPE